MADDYSNTIQVFTWMRRLTVEVTLAKPPAFWWKRQGGIFKQHARHSTTFGPNRP
jgi:hypothetical protein